MHEHLFLPQAMMFLYGKASSIQFTIFIFVKNKGKRLQNNTHIDGVNTSVVYGVLLTRSAFKAFGFTVISGSQLAHSCVAVYVHLVNIKYIV